MCTLTKSAAMPWGSHDSPSACDYVLRQYYQQRTAAVEQQKAARQQQEGGSSKTDQVKNVEELTQCKE